MHMKRLLSFGLALAAVLLLTSRSWAQISVTPTMLDFGVVQPGTTTTKTVAVTGIDSRWVTISNVNSPGGNWSANWNGKTTFWVNAGQTKNVTVSFHPRTVGKIGPHYLHLNWKLVALTGASNTIATPTPASVGSEITINAPRNGQAVSGALTVAVTLGPDVYWNQLMVDGTSVLSGSGNFTWDSATVANGEHILMVRVFQQGGTVPIGTASISVIVNNLTASPTPAPSSTPARSTPNPTPEPSPTSTPSILPVGHLSNLPPAATLPTEASCATAANQSNFPETSSWNVDDGTGWNANNQIWTTPSYFFTNAGSQIAYPNIDFANVDGNYTGSTQDIIRWAACKWGADEDWAYAESQEETGGWHNDCAQLHGGIGCGEGGDCSNPDGSQISGSSYANLSFLGFATTNSSGGFVGPDSVTADCLTTWASWGIIQSKVNYAEWYTWPMIAISTAWGEDYRWAKYRSCMNGDAASRFNNSDYAAAVSRARSTPNGLVPDGQSGPNTYFTNETNLQYLGLGCVGTHYSGGWYDSDAESYIATFMSILNSSGWPGGRR